MNMHSRNHACSVFPVFSSWLRVLWNGTIATNHNMKLLSQAFHWSTTVLVTAGQLDMIEMAHQMERSVLYSVLQVTWILYVCISTNALTKTDNLPLSIYYCFALRCLVHFETWRSNCSLQVFLICELISNLSKAITFRIALRCSQNSCLFRDVSSCMTCNLPH